VIAVEGNCDPRFEPLRDAFRANFAERGELGAAVCVMINGRIVADLYGGWADQEHGRRWRPDTLVNVFSVGRGLIAACTARLASASSSPSPNGPSGPAGRRSATSARAVRSASPTPAAALPSAT